MSTAPKYSDDNWFRFGEPSSSDEDDDEIIFDTDCDESLQDSYGEES